MTGGFVYVLADQSGRHKIGSAIDPIARRAALQTGHPEVLSFVYIGVAPEGVYTAIERAAHSLLEGRRITAGGSWFSVPASIAIGAVMEASHRNSWPIQQVSLEMVPTIIHLANQPQTPAVPDDHQEWIVRWVLAALFVALMAGVIWSIFAKF
jgi:hypothetical protein